MLKIVYSKDKKVCYVIDKEKEKDECFLLTIKCSSKEHSQFIYQILKGLENGKYKIG